MANPATVTKTLTITMLSLSAGKVPSSDPAAQAAAIASRAAAQPRLKAPSAAGLVIPAPKPVVPAPVAPPAPAKDGFYIMLAAGDGARNYSRKLLQLCEGKMATDRGATDLGTIPDSLTAAIATLQSAVAALVTSLTASNKLTF